ncbi:transcription factor Opi1-domain-containing protein [Flammula alnicola]|nr:transcription factor Opi1-domain-containing protein [Flammula alnicola]
MDDSPQPILGLEDQEESVRIAVKALGDMRNSGARSENSRTLPSLSTPFSSRSSTSSSKSPPLRSPSSSQTRDSPTASEAASSPPAFVSRMSHFPLVNSALRVYEQGKASSRVVKYGAEMVESSVKSISRPVIDRLPVNVNQLDEFACRQLDRQPISFSSTSRDRGRPKLKTKTFDGTTVEGDDEDNISHRGEAETENNAPSSPGKSPKRDWRGNERGVPSWLEANSPFVAPPPPPPDSRSSTPTQNGDDSRSERSQSRNPTSGNNHQVAQRSRWQAVLLEAGGLSAALSEESMRRLKYCLQWLQYATAHIDAQILILRDFTANLQPLPSDSLSTTRRPPISEDHMRKLTDVRRDIVHTIRQVVDVVSKYAGGALPEPARNRVRGFILKLPQRWASKAGPGPASGMNGANVPGERETIAAAGTGTGALRRPGGQRRAAHRERGTGAPEPGVRSGPNSRAASPSSSPRITRAVLSRQSEVGEGNRENGHVVSARILALATESLDMMRNVTGVVKDSLDRADAWVGRLRTVGIQRGAQEGEDTEESEFDSQSTTTQFDDTHDGGGMPSPFFSGSSTNWGSSIPSTPGAGRIRRGMPGAIPIGAMSLGSRYSTPKSVLAGLPGEEERGGRVKEVVLGANVNVKVQGRVGEVTVVGVDGEIEEEEKGVQKMDVDV